MAKHRRKVVTEMVDVASGEVKMTEETYEVDIPSPPKYVMMFLEDISYLHHLPKNAMQVFGELLVMIDYKSSHIRVTAYDKKIIAKRCGLTTNTVNAAISRLTKSNMLIRLGGGSYMANPKYFGIGNMQKVLRQQSEIRLTFIYTPKGRKTKVEIE